MFTCLKKSRVILVELKPVNFFFLGLEKEFKRDLASAFFSTTRDCKTSPFCHRPLG